MWSCNSFWIRISIYNGPFVLPGELFYAYCNQIIQILMLYYLMLPVKIIDPHSVSLFFDDYKRVYLHATTELENRRAWVAECSLNIQVTTGVEGNICLVGLLQTKTCHSLLDHMCNIHFLRSVIAFIFIRILWRIIFFQLASFLRNSKFKILFFY